MWNYAMLDLGATLCTARNHGDDCPLEKLHGKVQDFSYKKPQKKFVGSDRFYRGRILARLTQSSASKNNLVNALGIESELINRLLEKLLKEELIMTKRGRFRLP